MSDTDTATGLDVKLFPLGYALEGNESSETEVREIFPVENEIFEGWLSDCSTD